MGIWQIIDQPKDFIGTKATKKSLPSLSSNEAMFSFEFEIVLIVLASSGSKSLILDFRMKSLFLCNWIKPDLLIAKKLSLEETALVLIISNAFSSLPPTPVIPITLPLSS